MKKIIIFLLSATVAIGLGACGSAGGLEVKSKKNDLTLKNLSDLQDFNPKRTVWVKSNHEDYAGQVDSAIPDRKLQNFTVKNGKERLPLDVFQRNKKGEIVPLMTVEKDMKINREPAISIAEGLKPLGQMGVPMTGAPRTFKLCAVIKAERVSGRDRELGVDPWMLSIRILDETDPASLALHHYDKNQKDVEVYELSKFDNKLTGVYSIILNVDDGRKFALFKGELPADLTNQCLKLSGLRMNDEGLLELTGASTPLATGNGKKSTTTKKSSGLNKVRMANWENYPNGAVSISTEELKVTCFELYQFLTSSQDANGRSPIGLQSDGKVNETVVVGYDLLRDRCPELFKKYQAKMVAKPTPNTNGNQAQTVNEPAQPRSNPPRNNNQGGGGQQAQTSVAPRWWQDLSNSFNAFWNQIQRAFNN